MRNVVEINQESEIKPSAAPRDKNIDLANLLLGKNATLVINVTVDTCDIKDKNRIRSFTVKSSKRKILSAFADNDGVSIELSLTYLKNVLDGCYSKLLTSGKFESYADAARPCNSNLAMIQIDVGDIRLSFNCKYVINTNSIQKLRILHISGRSATVELFNMV